MLPRGLDDWRLHAALHPTEADLIVHKTHSNAFEEAALQQELAGRGMGRVVVAGLVTHGCVKATCLGARALSYDVVLAADGHSSYSKDAAGLIEDGAAAGAVAQSVRSWGPAATTAPCRPPRRLLAAASSRNESG